MHLNKYKLPRLPGKTLPPATGRVALVKRPFSSCVLWRLCDRDYVGNIFGKQFVSFAGEGVTPIDAGFGTDGGAENACFAHRQHPTAFVSSHTHLRYRAGGASPDSSQNGTLSICQYTNECFFKANANREFFSSQWGKLIPNGVIN